MVICLFSNYNKDTHRCPVCNAVCKDRDHLLSYYQQVPYQSYLDNFGSPPAASVAIATAPVEAVSPVHHANDNSIVVATTGPLCQRYLSDFWSFT